MTKAMLRRALLSCSVAAVVPTPAQAHAPVQTAEAPMTKSADSNNAPAVGEIVVTAQRRAQKLLDVPLSISAATGTTLNKLGVRDIVSIQNITPGFVPLRRSDSTLIFIRGIGNGLFTGADPSVATYVDDVPRIYGQLVNTLIDVERIEILKGAQGGLYGRNATGGVLNIITRAPSTQNRTSDALLSYGSRNTFRLAAHANIPIGSKAAFSVSGTRERHDPYAKNDQRSTAPYTATMFPSGSYLGTPQQTADFFNSGVRPRKGYNAENLWATNAKLLLLPTENLKITIAGDYNDADDTQGVQARQLFPAYLQGSLESFFSNFGIDTSLPAGFVYTSNKKFHVARSAQSRNVLRSYGGSITAVASFSDFDVTSITAARGNYAFAFDELGDVNVPLITNNSTKKAHFFYQEFRVASTGGGPFHFLGGATYLKNHFGQDTFSTILPPLFDTAVTSSVARVANWSVYGQLRYDITQALNITASARYIHEINHTSFSLPVESASRQVAKKVLPSVTLSFALENGGNAYLRWARGLKGGGVNPVVPPSTFPTALGSLFGPEIVDTYEIGYRASLADHQVQLTTAIFYNDYRGLQVSVSAKPEYPAIIYTIVNAGTARTYGAEASLTWRVARPLTLGVNGGYLNAKYKRFSVPDGTPLQPFDLSGQQMKNAPKWQFSFTSDLDVPVTGNLRIVGSALAAYTSEILYSSSGFDGVLPAGIQPKYWLVNARVGLATPNDRYRVSLFANNLLNKEYSVSVQSVAATGITATLGDPRIVGLEVAAKF